MSHSTINCGSEKKLERLNSVGRRLEHHQSQLRPYVKKGQSFKFLWQQSYERVCSILHCIRTDRRSEKMKQRMIQKVSLKLNKLSNTKYCVKDTIEDFIRINFPKIFFSARFETSFSKICAAQKSDLFSKYTFARQDDETHFYVYIEFFSKSYLSFAGTIKALKIVKRL